MRVKIQTKSTIMVLVFCAVMGANSFAQTFTKIDTSIICTIGGYSNSAAFGDFNNDGLDDLLIINTSNTSDPNSHFLFSNNGNWSFNPITEGDIVEYSSSYGAHGANWGDYNNDGYLDLFIANHFNNNNVLFTNNGDGTLTQEKTGSVVNDGGNSGPARWIDIENDGYIDLYVGNMDAQKNYLYHNNSGNSFTRFAGGQLVNFVFSEDGGPYSVDVDNDRDDDIFGISYLDRNYLYLSDGDGNFSPVESGDIIENGDISVVCGWGDYDNDSYLDVFIPTWDQGFGSGKNDILCKNNGDGTFSKASGIAPVNEKVGTDDGCWADFDNDGYLDLFTSAYNEARNTLFKNNGDGTFTKVDVDAFTDVEGGHASISDMNNDGFMDIFIPRGYGNFGPTKNVIFANDGNDNSWLTVNLSGTVSNKKAIGARVKAKATIDGTTIWQVREIGVSGLAGHTHAHFGFGDATLIDSLVIEWPAGHDTILENVAVKQILDITEEIPERYLRASFGVDTTMGRGELVVQFTDISRFDPANPITSWAWDFDGDGVVDSDEQNPKDTFSYSIDKTYDVKLVVSNGTDADSITRKDFILLYPFMAENLAQWGRATASSEEFPSRNAQSAIDGELLSRWSSEYFDNEWLQIEMDSVYTIGKVVMHWEDAYGKGYKLLASIDGETWDTVYCENAGNGSEDTLLFTGVDAKYVKLEGIERGTSYGYSIYELEIYRSEGSEYDATCTGGIIGIEDNLGTGSDIRIYPNPFKKAVSFVIPIEMSGCVQLDVIDVSGKKVAAIYSGQLNNGEHTIKWDRTDMYGSKVGSGFYIYTLKIGDTIHSTGKLMIID